MAYRDDTGQGVWARLDGKRTALMTRVQRYAALTIPKVCLPDGFDSVTTDQTHDYQSIGAQAVNHVVNKLMLAMFAPSRPFFKVQPDKKMAAELKQQGVDDAAIGAPLSAMEREAVALLDGLAQRPKLYQVMRHLVVAGNVLLCLEAEQLRVMGLRYFCVKRCADGTVHTLVIREKVHFDELADDVRAVVKSKHGDEDEVEHYRVICRQPDGKGYTMTQWVGSDRLPSKFDGKWTNETMPYRVLVWDLSDESDYGTGLVEEYAGDFEALSMLSESTVDGAILASEMRWMVNPAGMTSVDDLNKSSNGDALPGGKDDVTPVTGGNNQAIQSSLSIIERYEQRVARGFLLNSAVTRNAERVTAEEIRATAQELETSFGGVYSMLAPTVQLPLAHWLLKGVEVEVAKTKLKVTVITGLDALSRNGDLENLRLCFNDLASMQTLPPEIVGRANIPKLTAFIGAGRGIDFGAFFLSDEQYAAKQQQDQQSRVAEASATAGGEAQAQANAQPTP